MKMTDEQFIKEYKRLTYNEFEKLYQVNRKDIRARAISLNLSKKTGRPKKEKII